MRDKEGQGSLTSGSLRSVSRHAGPRLVRESAVAIQSYSVRDSKRKTTNSGKLERVGME